MDCLIGSYHRSFDFKIKSRLHDFARLTHDCSRLFLFILAIYSHLS
nr:MAG TPA: hypothetical protein [Caudoviricetes sp.]